jgi:hypothetical protein
MTSEEYSALVKMYEEKDIYNNVPFPSDSAHVCLFGFFQDYTVFDGLKLQLFDIIGIPKIRHDVLPILRGPAFLEKELFQKNTPTISLHIRRGDYEKMPCYFLLINQYYYKLALLNIINRVSTNLNVLVFYEKSSTESANAIIDHLKCDVDLMGYSVQFYHFNELIHDQNEQVNDIEEMAIMSHCDHHIITNSTYSWWSAYINPNADKIVCYPNQFYNHQLYYLSIKGLEVENWTSIPAWNPTEQKCNCNKK